MTDPLLDLEGLHKVRRDSERVFEVELPRMALAPGARVALTGESGSGKSTILSMLALATAPDRAHRFRFDGADIVSAWTRGDQSGLTRLRAGAIAYLPQRDGLLDFLTIRRNIDCAAELGGALPVEDIDEITTSLKLQDLLEARPAQLSGGQRQRAAVACALARRPRLILADEPTASLDADNARRVIDSLCTLSSAVGAAIVFATHQLAQIRDRGFDTFAARLDGRGPAHRSRFEPI